MHVLFIPSAYPTKENPLSSIFYKEQALAIKDADNKVGVIFAETRRVSKINYNMLKNNHFQIKRYNENGLITYRLHGWNIFTMRGPLGINFWVKQSLKLFEQYITTEGIPDIIHVHSALYGGLVGKEIKRIYNIPYVITEHSSAVLQKILREHDIPILESVYNNSNHIISVGKALKKAIGEYTEKSIDVIPNIVDINRFSINKKENDNFTFISICHLKENKNVDLTIKAFYEVVKKYKNGRLLIVGDGPERQNLTNLVSGLGIQNNIEFVGAVSRENLNKYINRADAFVLPSKYETFGIAYIEALACGIPIITSKCGGPEDFFCDDIGYMISLDKDNDLKDAMLSIIENIDKFDSYKLRLHVESRFSKEVVADKIIKAYRQVLSMNGDNNE
jgi:L-malate glycosyltransferase